LTVHISEARKNEDSTRDAFARLTRRFTPVRTKPGFRRFASCAQRKFDHVLERLGAHTYFVIVKNKL
jgi:hypothetical protein